MLNYSTPKRTSGAHKVELRNVELTTPEGRPLFHDLNMILDNEQVAVIGRNGVGKTTFLKALSGNYQHDKGEICLSSEPVFVPQEMHGNGKDSLAKVSLLLSGEVLEKQLRKMGLPPLSTLRSSNQMSCGERRKLHLLVARILSPDILLLDEPTEDLDVQGTDWLKKWLSTCQKCVITVSHDRKLLSEFKHFFIISETGCNYFNGTFSELRSHLATRSQLAAKIYFKNLHTLSTKEESAAKIQRRRQRKKNYGRISELKRCTPKQRLNKKRGKAQVSQGKNERISQDRINQTRNLALSSRRDLKVNLELKALLSQQSTIENRDLIHLENVGQKFNGRYLFKNISFSLGPNRMALVGPNGAGKTTLLKIIMGNVQPTQGRVTTNCITGEITQGGSNWITKKSLKEMLLCHTAVTDVEEISILLTSHMFPLTLANRPLSTLSPGERVRAALICLFQRTPKVELLILDEPNYSLDHSGEKSLAAVLNSWQGGLIISSHNREFLKSISISRQLTLLGKSKSSLQTFSLHSTAS